MSAKNPTLCANCQKKPNFGNFKYCGKTCAAEAAAMCDHCGKKPKFNGHKFCSKTCGIQARRQQQPRNSPIPTPQQGAPQPNILLWPPPAQAPQIKKKKSLASRLLKAFKCDITPPNPTMMQSPPQAQYLFFGPQQTVTTQPSLQPSQTGPIAPGGILPGWLCIMCRQKQAMSGSRFCGKECRKEALKTTL